MSKARDLADFQGSASALTTGTLPVDRVPYVGRRNLIINGGFDVWQRGTSHSTNGYGSADRWYLAFNGSATAQKVEDTVAGKKVVTISSTASGQTYHVLQQRIEFLRRYQGRVLTLSAWVKGTAGTHTQYLEFRDSGGNSVDSITFPITYTGSWQYVTHTFTVPTNASYDNDSSWFNVSFYGGDSLALSQVQLELGSVATPFEHRSYGEELALCYRYYIRYGSANGANTPSDYTNITTAHGTSSAWYVPFQLPMRMRAAPSLSYSSVSDFRCTLQHSDSDTCSSMMIGYGDEFNPTLSIQAGANGANRTRMFGYNGTYGAWIAWDAEL